MQRPHNVSVETWEPLMKELTLARKNSYMQKGNAMARARVETLEVKMRDLQMGALQSSVDEGFRGTHERLDAMHKQTEDRRLGRVPEGATVTEELAAVKTAMTELQNRERTLKLQQAQELEKTTLRAIAVVALGGKSTAEDYNSQIKVLQQGRKRALREEKVPLVEEPPMKQPRDPVTIIEKNFRGAEHDSQVRRIVTAYKALAKSQAPEKHLTKFGAPNEWLEEFADTHGEAMEQVVAANIGIFSVDLD